MSEPTIPCNIQQFKNSVWSTEPGAVPAELPVLLTVNGEPWLEFMCTTAPTAMAVKMADRWGLTLIGYAYGESFKVYTHPERIEPH